MTGTVTPLPRVSSYDEFKAALADLCPVYRAKAIVAAIEALPVGTRIAGYVREPGRDRWRCEYTSIKRRRDGRTETITHASYTGAWSLAMDVAFAPPHRAEQIEAIRRIAFRMIAEGRASWPEKIETAPTPPRVPVEVAPEPRAATMAPAVARADRSPQLAFSFA